MADPIVQRLRQPSFTDSEWTTANPLLLSGEIGFEIDGVGLVKNFKAGPGYWNDLSYVNDVDYTYSDIVTNEIGDAVGDLSGKRLTEIVHLMLNPYEPTVISDLENNADGTYKNDAVFEIGQSISGTVNVQYTIAFAVNLSGAEPINVVAGGVFSNEGDFADGIIGLTLAAPHEPTLLEIVTIRAKATHTNGISAEITATIRWHSRIIWGTSNQESLTAAEFAGMADRQDLVSDSYKNTYSFNSAGYLYVGIPSNMSPTDVKFVDATEEVEKIIDMTSLGTLVNVSNGVGTYNYELYRSTYLITEGTSKIRVA